MEKPVVFVLDDEQGVLDALVSDLEARFGGDCRIIGEPSAAAGLDQLRELHDRSEPVAVVIADEHMSEMGGIDVLRHAHALHPKAKRVLLVERDYSSTSPVVHAITVGDIDYHLVKPWLIRRGLYLTVAEVLAEWAKSSQEPLVKLFRVVGRQWDPRSHELRDLLSRLGLTYAFYTDESEPGRRLLEEFGQGDEALPVVVRYDGRTLVNPSNVEVIESFGVNTRLDAERVYDVVIIGAGPAGLAAAVYAASEGLETLVLERSVSGGQAAFSSSIRNYPGFPHGIGGDLLTWRACEQAWLFGANLVFAREATALGVRGGERTVRVADGGEVTTRTVVIASGVAWRRLGVEALERLIGAGVFYGTVGSEARAMADQDVFVVGAANSAGQAALHLAECGARVTMLVRRDSLAATMSHYLVTKIEETPNIEVRLQTRVVDGHGDGRLEAITYEHRDDGATTTVPAGALFALIGAEPHTTWLGGSVERDDRGYILTGRDVVRGGELPKGWSLERAPLLLETSIPGVFAAGDVRHGSVKRVASAVGEGAVSIQLVHEYCRDQAG